MSYDNNADPFAQRPSYPAVSFDNKPRGTRYRCKVIDLPELVQARNFESRERDFWPDGNPKMAAVISVEVNGEKMSLWAPKPSSMFAAIADAQTDAGARIAVGGWLEVEHYDDKPNSKNPNLNPAKQYRATYAPPNAFDKPEDTGTPVYNRQAPQTAPASSEPPF